MYSKILVPLDGSTRAETILSHAVSLASKYQARLILLQVVEPVHVQLAADELAEQAAQIEAVLDEKVVLDGHIWRDERRDVLGSDAAHG